MSLATDVARGTRSCLEGAARPLNAVSRAKAPRRNGINPCDSNPLRRGMRHAQAHRRRRRQSARWTASAGEGCTTQGAYQPELSGNPTTMPLETIHSRSSRWGSSDPGRAVEKRRSRPSCSEIGSATLGSLHGDAPAQSLSHHSSEAHAICLSPVRGRPSCGGIGRSQFSGRNASNDTASVWYRELHARLGPGR